MAVLALLVVALGRLDTPTGLVVDTLAAGGEGMRESGVPHVHSLAETKARAVEVQNAEKSVVKVSVGKMDWHVLVFSIATTAVIVLGCLLIVRWYAPPLGFEQEDGSGGTLLAEDTAPERTAPQMSLDSVLLERLCDMGMRISGLAVLLSAVLMPVYAAAAPADAHGLTRFALTSANTAGLWVATAALYAFAAGCCVIISREVDTFLELQENDLKVHHESAAVLLEKLPLHLRDQEALPAFLKQHLGASAVERVDWVDAKKRRAYVVLRSFRGVCEAQAIESCRVLFVPESADVMWNVEPVVTPSPSLVKVVVATMLVLWSVPVAALQLLCNWHYLEGLGFPPLPDHLQGLAVYLPAVAVLGLLAALPPLFQWLGSRVEHLGRTIDVETATARRLYRFQMATLYFTVLSGSLYGTLQEIVHHPDTVLLELAAILPGLSVYFMTLVLGKIGGLAQLLASARVEATRQLMYGKQYTFPYYKAVPDLQFVFLILIFYAVIAPACSWIVFAFFVAARAIYPQVAPCFAPSHPSVGAAVCFQAFDNCLFAVQLGAVVLIANLILVAHAEPGLHGPWAAAVPVLVGLYFFRAQLDARLQGRTDISKLPLEVASGLDADVQ